MFRFSSIRCFSLIGVLMPFCTPVSAIDFVEDVRPILEEHCYECHGTEKQKSGLRLDVKSAALKGGSGHAPDIVPGNPEESPIIRFTSGTDPEIRMPPEGPLLPEAKREVLRQWVEAGAPWPDGVDLTELEDRSDHWAFRPVSPPAPPEVPGSSWPVNDIDRFIIARLEQEKMTPSQPADRVTWLRRVTFDLTGLPPTLEEIDNFLTDQSDSARETVVERLLSSPRYGERWAQHWLDVVRYADTHGYEVNTERPNAWPYRDYVIESFNEDTPYDQFIREQLAGDTMEKDAATGFLVTSAVLLPGQIGKDDASKRLARQDELTEIVTNTGEAFLGLSVGCARCHDHKFDPMTSKDFYSMQAFFAGVEFGDRPLPNTDGEEVSKELTANLSTIETSLVKLITPANSGQPRPAINAEWNVERFEPVLTDRVRLTIESTNNLEPCIDELEVFDTNGKNVALHINGGRPTASGSKTSPNRHELRFVNDGNYGNSRSWMSNEKGKGWVQIRLKEKTLINRVAWGRDKFGKYKDRLATNYTVDIQNDDKEWITVADSKDRAEYRDKATAEASLLGVLYKSTKDDAAKFFKERKPLIEKLRDNPAGDLVYAGKFKEPESIFLLNRGDPEQPKSEVVPAVLESLGNLELEKAAKDKERRVALADWIASPEHPLTARVMVNRIWQWHFGTGFVDTPNDFGRAGSKPTHPELLDWLATEFVRSGWSIKHLHRLIVLSATYDQSHHIRADHQLKDADTRLLWRYPSRRLEAEAIRDSMLATSGRLNLAMGGRGFDLFQKRGGLSGFPPVESFDEKGRRRMIYSHKIRMERSAVFGAFDCPDAGQSLPRRRQSTTPIQALNLFNSAFTIDEANAFAERVSGEANAKPEAQASQAWRLTYGREPDAEEIADAVSIIQEHGLPVLCRALFNSNEFLFLP